MALVEEFGPDIKYIKGKANSVADAISRLKYSGKSQPSDTTVSLEELFTLDKNGKVLFPMILQVIAEAQEGCTNLQDQLKDENNEDENNKVYTTKLINDIEIIFYMMKSTYQKLNALKC